MRKAVRQAEGFFGLEERVEGSVAFDHEEAARAFRLGAHPLGQEVFGRGQCGGGTVEGLGRRGESGAQKQDPGGTKEDGQDGPQRGPRAYAAAGRGDLGRFGPRMRRAGRGVKEKDARQARGQTRAQKDGGLAQDGDGAEEKRQEADFGRQAREAEPLGDGGGVLRGLEETVKGVVHDQAEQGRPQDKRQSVDGGEAQKKRREARQQRAEEREEHAGQPAEGLEHDKAEPGDEEDGKDRQGAHFALAARGGRRRVERHAASHDGNRGMDDLRAQRVERLLEFHELAGVGEHGGGEFEDDENDRIRRVGRDEEPFPRRPAGIEGRERGDIAVEEAERIFRGGKEGRDGGSEIHAQGTARESGAALGRFQKLGGRRRDKARGMCAAETQKVRKVRAIGPGVHPQDRGGNRGEAHGEIRGGRPCRFEVGRAHKDGHEVRRGIAQGGGQGLPGRPEEVVERSLDGPGAQAIEQRTECRENERNEAADPQASRVHFAGFSQRRWVPRPSSVKSRRMSPCCGVRQVTFVISAAPDRSMRVKSRRRGASAGLSASAHPFPSRAIHARQSKRPSNAVASPSAKASVRARISA